MSNKKQILFRADGNAKTGLGHLFRLFAIVEMVKDDYDYVYFTKPDSTISVIPEYYNHKVLPEHLVLNDEAWWLSEHFNPEETIVIADGYQFNSAYQKKIKEKGFQLVYIDDLAREYMYADVVVNHSPHVKEADYKAEPYTTFALGTQYAILRPAFLDAAKQTRTINKIDTVFVCFGGADFNDITNTCLKGILQINSIKNIHVVLGGAYAHNAIYNTIYGRENKVSLHKNLAEKKIINLMKECQLAIVPASTISYEACSVKMVVLSGYYVDNQIGIYKGYLENNLIYDAGDLNTLTSEDFKNLVFTILQEDPNGFQKKIDKQKCFFDGKQKQNFINLIKKLDYAS